MQNVLSDFDFSTFWDNCAYAETEYVGAAVTLEMLNAVEREIRYHLPSSYIDLITQQNGGIPFATNHRTPTRTSWASDHIAITGIYGIDSDKPSSLLGEFGSKFWISEWGYPDIGIYFADCPSAGHDMLCMDYSTCGLRGEPRIVHVDQECDYRITLVAPSFSAFIRGLELDSVFESEDE